MPRKWYDSILIEKEAISDSVSKFILEVPELDAFDFEAGQFITMDLPVSEKRRNRWRSYSIANPPNHTNQLELCIVKLEGGLGTTYLFNTAKVGDELKFKGPDGAFYLPKEITNDLVMICTGTGVAPFRSMIANIIKTNRPCKNIHLIFGSRQESDILYRSEFEEWADKYDWFTYDVCLSRATEWDGFKGYVHQVYMDENFSFNPETKFYLCGWSQMIDEAVANLLVEKKVDRKNIIYELYG